jgi:GNAT superfamily N-acetyltransferase
MSPRAPATARRARRAGTRPARLVFRPLTPSRWQDLVRLFGPRGASGGCWCMYWRRKRSEYVRGKGAGNRAAFRRIVAAGGPPGILAYEGRRPIAWCAVARRSEYPVLANSRILSAVDDQPVWSITCFYVHRDYRRAGVTVPLLRAAVDHVKRRGGGIVEGYPIDPGSSSFPSAFAWTGLASAFRQAGFKEVARRSATRPIMQYRID